MRPRAIRKYVHLPHVSLSSNPALRMICTWLETDDCGIPRMSANSHTHSARSITNLTILHRVSSDRARQNATAFVITKIIVSKIFVMTTGIFGSVAFCYFCHGYNTKPKNRTIRTLRHVLPNQGEGGDNVEPLMRLPAGAYFVGDRWDCIPSGTGTNGMSPYVVTPWHGRST